MIALLGVRDAAPGKKGSPQKGRPVTGLLHQAEVDVKHQVLLGVKAQQIDDMVQLLPVCNLEDPLSLLLVLFRLAVKGQVEGPAKQLGQPGGEIGIFRDDPHLGGAEGVAVERRCSRRR